MALIKRVEGRRAKLPAYWIVDPDETLDRYARLEAIDGYLSPRVKDSTRYAIRRPSDGVERDRALGQAPLRAQFWRNRVNQVWGWEVRGARLPVGVVGKGRTKTLREAARDLRNFLHDGSLEEALVVAAAVERRRKLARVDWE
jgi:hypothetical protein